MLSIRSCLAASRSIASASAQTFLAAQRSFSLYAQSIRPSLPAAPTLETTSVPSPYRPLELVRGAKRDTYNPSHRVRKRRHGYLSRLKTRNGRKTLLRRMLKGRSNLSH